MLSWSRRYGLECWQPLISLAKFYFIKRCRGKSHIHALDCGCAWTGAFWGIVLMLLNPFLSMMMAFARGYIAPFGETGFPSPCSLSCPVQVRSSSIYQYSMLCLPFLAGDLPGCLVLFFALIRFMPKNSQFEDTKTLKEGMPSLWGSLVHLVQRARLVTAWRKIKVFCLPIKQHAYFGQSNP